MPAQATTKAVRKKVRCPKCTALFTQPAKHTFDCPICSCRLSVNGTITLTDVVRNQTKAEESVQVRTAAANSNDEPSRTQSPMGIVKKEGDKGASVDQIHNIQEKQPITDTEKEFPRVSENDNENRQKLCVNGNIEDPHSANEEAGRDINTTGELSSDNAAEEASSLLRVADHLIVAEDDVEKNGARDRRLQSQLFQTSRCEFSFKYSLGGVSPMESDGQLRRRKGSLSSKIVPSETAVSRNQASDTPLYPPLRVRISHPHEESSDQSENGRYSFNSETDSSDGSDFGFPAPQAEGLGDIVLPASFGQTEIFRPSSDCIVSAAPHQLELQDVDDVIDHLQESSECFEGAKVELSKQVEDSGETMSNVGRESIISEFNHKLDEVDSKEILSTKGSTGKLCAFGFKQGSDSAEEQETVLNQDMTVHLGEVGKMESNAHVPRGVSERIDADADYVKSCEEDVVSLPLCSTADLATSTLLSSQEDIKTKASASNLSRIDSSDEAQRIPSTGHLGLPMVGSPEIGQDVLDQSHIYHNIMSSGTIRHELSGMREGQLADSLLSNTSKIEQSHNSPDARNHNMSDHQLLSSMENAELEVDLYSPPVEVLVGNDSSSGKSLYPDLWEEKKSAVLAMCNGVLVNTSKGRMYYEKNDPLRSSHGKFHENSEAELTRSDNGEEFFMTGSDRNLRGHAASQGNRFQTEHVDWKGHIMAAENQGKLSGMHEMDGNPGSYSQYSVNNAPGLSLANPQPYVLTNHNFVSDHLGFGSSSTNQMYPYPVPSQSLVLPAAFQNHALTHCGYHAMSPACMLCSYHQHPHIQPPHIPHCSACYNQSGSIAYTSGHAEHWNCYQVHRGSAPTYANSLVEGSQACSFSANLAHRHDFLNTELKSQASSARKAGQYPPLPRDSAAPYVTCKGCSRVLQVPSGLPPTDGITQKLRCGACRKITKFSVDHYNQQRHVLSSIPPSELDLMGGATNLLPLVQYSMATESVKPSYNHDTNPVLREQSVHKVWSQPDNTTPTKFASSISDQNPQRGQFVGGQPRNRVVDASLSLGPSPLENAASLTHVMSPRRDNLRPTDSFGFDRSKVNPAASFHLPVDEKEEGLDFGAPRISDGDSLDQSESRMRSPENIQALHQRNPVEVPLEHPPPPEQVPGSPLLVLLNQESTRFRLTLEPRVPLEESRSAVCSPASESPSPLYDNHPHGRERYNAQSHGSSAQHFVSKGPKYIAGLLRRSLKEFGRGGQ